MAKITEADGTLRVSGCVLQPSTVVRNLCVYIDEQLSIDANACQDVFYHLRRIRQLRRHVDYDTLGSYIRLYGR